MSHGEVCDPSDLPHPHLRLPFQTVFGCERHGVTASATHVSSPPPSCPPRYSSSLKRLQGNPPTAGRTPVVYSVNGISSNVPCQFQFAGLHQNTLSKLSEGQNSFYVHEPCQSSWSTLLQWWKRVKGEVMDEPVSYPQEHISVSSQRTDETLDVHYMHYSCPTSFLRKRP